MIKHQEITGLRTIYLILLVGCMLFPGGLHVAHACDEFACLVVPGIEDRLADYNYTIAWEDSNQNDHRISLFYDTDTIGEDGTLIVQDIDAGGTANYYIWNTASLDEGEYYIYIRYDDGMDVHFHYLQEPIKIQHSRGCLDISTRKNLLSNGGFEDGSPTAYYEDWLDRGRLNTVKSIEKSLIKKFSKRGQERSLGVDRELPTKSPANWDVSTPSESRERSWEYAWFNDPNNAHSGNRAIGISNTFNGVNSSSAWEDRVIISSQMVDLPNPGGKYILTAWLKTENVQQGHVIFKAKYFDEKGNGLKIQGHDSDTFFSGGPGTEQWTRVVFFVDPPHWESPPYPETAKADKIVINFSLDNSPGKVWVDDVKLTEISDTEFDLYDPNNRYKPPPLETTFTPLEFSGPLKPVASIAADPMTGVWWFLDPSNNGTWLMGASIQSNPKLEKSTGLSAVDYRDLAQYRAGADLNFNQGWRERDASGGYSPIRNYIDWLNFSSDPGIDEPAEHWVLKDRNGQLIADKGHYFPDVFSPIWQKHAVVEAESLLDNGAWVLRNHDTIGYFTDNEIAYGDVYDFIWGDTAQLALIDWIQGKNELPSVDLVFKQAGSSIDLDVPIGYEISRPYLSIDNVNHAWSSRYHTYSYRAYEDIAGDDKPYIRTHDDPVLGDLFAFERLIYKIYVDTIVNNIRRVENRYFGNDQNYWRPIFSNRFDTISPASLDALGRNMDLFKQFDIIAINWYPGFNGSKTYHPKDWMETVENIFYTSTERPLYISEFGLASEDGDDFSSNPPLFVARWREKTVEYQYQRGWAYVNFVSTWANLPYVIGADWFQWSNGYGAPPGKDVRNSGLVDDRDHYYGPLADNVRSVNRVIQNITRNGLFGIDDIEWEWVDVNICGSD